MRGNDKRGSFGFFNFDKYTCISAKNYQYIKCICDVHSNN